MRPSIRPRSLPTLIHELDEVFSKWIRKRDTMPDGWIRCFTCLKKIMPNEAHCGHFVNRDKMPTRFDERNCHAVCEECNCFDTGHHGRYAEAMRKKYGTIECMDLLAKARGLQKFTRPELEELIAYYKSESRLNRTKV